MRSYPWIAIDRSGRLVAAYSNSPSIGHADAIGATLEAGAGAFTEPVQLGEAAHVTQPNGISTDSDGNTLVAVYKTDSPTEARVAPFDAAGPVMNGLSVPGSGTVDQALPFSVAPVDAWSPLGATAWSFGDGGTATGNSVSHVFSAPGSPQITVRAGDSLGNSSEAKGSTTIQGIPGKGVPQITNLKLSRKRFRAAGGTRKKGARTSKKRATPVGTRVSFHLSEAATVNFSIAASKNRAKGSKLLAALGKCCGITFSTQGSRGANSFKFIGKVNGRRLKPGKYVMTAVAQAASRAGGAPSLGHHSAPKSVTFIIVSH